MKLKNVIFTGKFHMFYFFHRLFTCFSHVFHPVVITDISLEYEIPTQPNLTRSIRSEYQHTALLYDRILRHRKIIVNKSDTVWNWAFNMPCKSLKGILVLFEDEQSYTRDTSKFYNPKIQKVSVIVEGKPNQLYA